MCLTHRGSGGRCTCRRSTNIGAPCRATPIGAALDNGIALQFDIDLQAQGGASWTGRSTLAALTRHLQLRYFPLSRQYQLRDLDQATRDSVEQIKADFANLELRSCN